MEIGGLTHVEGREQESGSHVAVRACWLSVGSVGAAAVFVGASSDSNKLQMKLLGAERL